MRNIPWILAICATGCAAAPCPRGGHVKPDIRATARVLERGSSLHLAVTIKNLSREQAVWLNGRFDEDGSPLSPVKVRVTDGYGAEVSPGLCGTEVRPTIAADYVVVKPGSEIRRELSLRCYDLANQKAFGVWLQYEDVNVKPPAPPAGTEYYWGPLRIGPIQYDRNLEPEE